MTLEWFLRGTFTPDPAATVNIPWTLLQAVRDEIRDLNLTGISDRNVNIRKVWDGTAQNTPNIQLTVPNHEEMPPLAGTNYRDDVVYQIMVTLTDKDNKNQPLHRGAYLQWRETIFRHFRCQPVESVAETYTCEASPLVVLDRKFWLDGWWVSRLLLNFYSRETRG